jgi:GNAT superfamily N-acetyltransferase
MLLLEPKDYHKATGPLRAVAINNLFARAVVEGHIDGTVHVDDAANPKTFHVVHSYGMSLLFGESGNAGFNAVFRDYAINKDRVRDKYEWLQAFPASWNAALAGFFAGSLVPSDDNAGRDERGVIELNTRVNFKFDPSKYPNAWRNGIPKGVTIVRTDRKIFDEMPGSVVPKYFWNNVEDFLSRGAGYSVICEGELAATAYASFVIDNMLELGIETVEQFRGKGFGKYACCALIDHCLERGLEPVWACRLENIGSYKLAQKIGFEDVARIPYYRLSN